MRTQVTPPDLKEAVMKNIAKSIGVILAGLIMVGAVARGANSQPGVKKFVTQDDQKSETKDLVWARTFNAPVAEVWKYWAESEGVKKWWGPNGFTSPLARMDFREGGTSLVCMRAPNGQDFYNTWTYRKIEPLKRIEFILGWADKDGQKIDPVTMGLPPDIPQEVRHVVTFKDVSGKTELTVVEYGYKSDQTLDLSKQGLEQCLDKMATALGGKHERKEER
jgi:uncharacterized protein YndB with AHSA1/START domain